MPGSRDNAADEDTTRVSNPASGSSGEQQVIGLLLQGQRDLNRKVDKLVEAHGEVKAALATGNGRMASIETSVSGLSTRVEDLSRAQDRATRRHAAPEKERGEPGDLVSMRGLLRLLAAVIALGGVFGIGRYTRGSTDDSSTQEKPHHQAAVQKEGG